MSLTGKNVNARKFAALVLLEAIAKFAYAAHPLVTDDTGTQGTLNRQIEASTDRAQRMDGKHRFGSLTYTYGLRENLDLFINVPLAFSSPAGLQDIAFGAKWRLAEANAFSLAVKPDLLLATGDQSKGLGNGRTSLALTLIGSYDAAPWIFHGNAGFTFNRYKLQADQSANRAIVWRTSTAVWYLLDRHWKLVADAGIVRDPVKTSATAPGYILTGAIYSPATNIDLDAGLKFGIGCRDCATQVGHQVGVGLTWRF
jgi:hypothetical protein